MARVYAQSITGKFRGIKNWAAFCLLAIYFLSSWLRWDRGLNMPNQAILMDLPNRKAYLFAIQIWPEEAYYLAALLMLGAMGLFFVTSLYGRIWCGYTCPHTVFVDLFIKVEHYFQGDRNARMKLDQSPWDHEKRKKKGLTYLCWLGIAFGFAFGWVCYFYDAPTLVKDIVSLSVTSGGLSWLLGLTASTFLFAGYVREQVCTYMCPYGRFQSVMLDNDSSIVTYHTWRGEPRGNYNPQNRELGDCIDCGKCVVVCPMGIDIREGMQLSCIGCGLCVDACNSVMGKLNRPLNLIGYDSVNSIEIKKKGELYKRKIFKLKNIIFAKVFFIVCSLVLYALLNKPLYSIAILKDRGALFTILPSGEIRNTYQLKLSNRTSFEEDFILSVAGLNDAEIKVEGLTESYAQNFSFTLKAEEEQEFKVYIKTHEVSNVSQDKIFFELKEQKSDKTISKETTFIFGNN
ncbi:MAG: cytochrome c oxidase accessory protein CcoG [Rickettsiales bacterium]